jgi:Mediator complex subunit MED14
MNGSPLPGPPAANPVPSIKASVLLHLALDSAYEDLHGLASNLGRETLDERREQVLSYVRLHRARFLRTYVAIRWLSEFGHTELTTNARDALHIAHEQRDKINAAQDRLYFMHGSLFGARQRRFDVATALDVLVGGSYPRLPLGIRQCGAEQDPTPLITATTPQQQAAVQARIERAIKLAVLVREPVPSAFTSCALRAGYLKLTAPGEFELSLTLESDSPDAQWSLRGLAIHVTARVGEAVSPAAIDARQSTYLQGLVQGAMNAASSDSAATATASSSSERRTTQTQRGSGIVAGQPLLTAYRLVHDFCMGLQLEMLRTQADALAKSGAPWHGVLQVIFYRAARVLDLVIWPKESGPGWSSAASSSTADSSKQQMLLRSATVNGVPPPVAGRYIRVYVADAATQQSRSEAQLLVLLSPATAFSSSTSSAPALHVKPDAISAGGLLLAAAKLCARDKLAALVKDIELAVATACSSSSSEQQNAAAAAVRQPRVSLSDAGHSLLVHCSSGGFVELAVDLRTGRSVAALSGALADDSLYRAFSSSSSSSSRAVLTQLQEAVDLPAGEQGRQHAQGRAQLARCVSAALRAGTVAHIEVQARCALGLEPHQRWQQLLVRPAGSGDTAAAAAATQQHSTSTYIPVATAQELGPVSSSSGVQWVPLAATDSVSGQYTSLLQVSARADGSASVCLHITSEGSTGLRPRIVGTKQYGSVATSVSSSSSSSMGVFDACPQRSDAAALRVSSRYAAESVLEPSDSSALVNAVADACRRLA